MKQKSPAHAEPSFTYTLRRWCDQENACGQIVLINSSRALLPEEIKSRLESCTHHPAEDFQFVEPEKDCSIVLDTWERGIESHGPRQYTRHVSVFDKWWSWGQMKLASQ